MRLLCTFENDIQGLEFSQFLKNEGIANECEVLSVSDWGSDAYGNRYCRIWVIDEDTVEKAEGFYEQYLANPHDPRFKEKTNLIKHILEPETQKAAAKEGLAKIQKAATTFQSQPVGPITFYTMLLCAVIFVLSKIYTPQLPPSLPAVVEPGLEFAYPANRMLAYDYPSTYEYLVRLINLYSVPDGETEKPDVKSLTPEAEFLIQQYRNTPVWTGFYDKVVLFLKGDPNVHLFDAPMFEKIRQGEVWRLFSPAVLHLYFFHLFFNMIWLLVLGKQIEHRLGAARYLLLLLIAAAVSNTAQYLMSGPNFIGFSGVVCAMLGFIYMRQKQAAWEGYQLQRVTLSFLVFFILMMLGIQTADFFADVLWNAHLTPRIANTAHLAGVAVGLLLGRMNFFAWKRKSHP